MMIRTTIAVSVFALLCVTAARASQPGQPLDCSDWVFLESGLSCTVYLDPGPPNNCGPYPFHQCRFSDQRIDIDNQGRRYTVVFYGGSGQCGSDYGVKLVRFNGTEQQTVAYVPGRCFPDRGGYPNGEWDMAQPLWDPTVKFDAVSGSMLIPLASSGTGYGGVMWIASINGFASLFDILQTYVPGQSSLGFRVPVMPDGLRRADKFDTYFGSVSDLPDFTQAHPMRCSYPASPPAAGDYLTVQDISPVPAPGAANYIVTAVTYQGQRRYGRRRIGGVLSGRDPAVLPTCP